MKICDTHWARMRAELDSLGLGRLGARSGEEAIAALARQLGDREAGGSGEPTDDEWDPLMAMNFAFWSRALEVVGLEAMSEGFGCLLCRVREDYDAHSRPDGCGVPGCSRERVTDPEPTDENWVKGCAQAMLAEARRRGLATVS